MMKKLASTTGINVPSIRNGDTEFLLLSRSTTELSVPSTPHFKDGLVVVTSTDIFNVGLKLNVSFKSSRKNSRQYHHIHTHSGCEKRTFGRWAKCSMRACGLLALMLVALFVVEGECDVYDDKRDHSNKVLTHSIECLLTLLSLHR